MKGSKRERSNFYRLVADFRSATAMGIRYTRSAIRNRETDYQTPAIRSSNGTTVVVIDPNNEAVYFWHRIWRWTRKPPKVIRIDKYSNMEKDPNTKPNFPLGVTFATATPTQIFHYVHKLGDQSFLDFAVRHHFIQPFVTGGDPDTGTFEMYSHEPTRNPPFYRLSEEEAVLQRQQHDPNIPCVWDIDLVAFSSVYDASHDQGTIDRRIETAEAMLREARAIQKPRCVTIAQSQTPVRYVPVDTLAYVREKTLEMVERVAR